MSMLRLLIAEGDEVRREQLRRLVEKQASWRVCGQASGGPEAVQLALQLSPHVAIVSLALARLNGLQAIRQIKRHRPDTEVLAVTAHETDDLVRDVLFGGAQACLQLAEVADHLPAAVDALAHHRAYLTPGIIRAVLPIFLAQGAGPQGRPSSVLTAREREILQLLAEGRSNAAISELLGISVKTVETHRGMIMKRLGVSSLAELVRYAMRNRVIGDI
jgi:DNA-binding NarL/FixJ family response regulator